MHRLPLILLLLFLSLALAACESKKEPQEPPPTEDAAPPAPPAPPPPPDFEGEPQLSLFPRAGDYRPADDSDNLPYWATFIEHLLRTSGVAQSQGDHPNRVWAFRSINTLDSIGFFSPLAVEPGDTYRVSFRIQTDLANGASAGIGIIEFDEFLWIGEQFTEALVQEHQRRSYDGLRLKGRVPLTAEQSFTFTAGPQTRMIHLILFREGPHDRTPVLLDDIRVERVEPAAAASPGPTVESRP